MTRNYYVQARPAKNPSAKKRNSAPPALPVILAMLWLYYAYEVFAASRRPDPWITAEWLISWPNGFQRRGLIGELIIDFSNGIGFSPATMVAVLQTLFCGIFLYGLWLLLRDNFSGEALLLMTLPTGLAVYFYDLGYLGRKEIIFFAVSVWWVIYKRKNADGSWPIDFAFLLAFTFVYFSHEGLALFAPILSVPFLARGASFRKTVSCVVPGFAGAFSLLLIFLSPNPSSLATCRRLLTLGYPESVCAGAISWLDRGITEVWAIVSDELIGKPAALLYALSMLWLFTIFIIAAHFNSGTKTGSIPAIKYLVAIVLTAPIFILSLDWGRWVHIITVATTLVFLVRSETRGSVATFTMIRRLEPIKFSIYWAIAIFQLFFLGQSHYGGRFLNLITVAVEMIQAKLGI